MYNPLLLKIKLKSYHQYNISALKKEFIEKTNFFSHENNLKKLIKNFRFTKLP